MSKLGELRAKKEKVDQITELMHEMRMGDVGAGEKGRRDKEDDATPTNPKTEDIPLAKSARSSEGASELVTDRKNADVASPNLEELQAKLRLASAPIFLSPNHS